MQLLRLISNNLTSFEKRIILYLTISLIVGATLKFYGHFNAGNYEVKTSMRKININEADLQDLVSIPGIGVKTARAIIEYRHKHGPFASIDEIKNVKGIGEKKFGRIKDYIVVH